MSNFENNGAVLSKCHNNESGDFIDLNKFQIYQVEVG